MLDPKLILVSIIWGMNFVLVKFALQEFAPLSFTLVRFALAALFLFSVMLAKHEPLALERRDVLPVIGLGFTGITLYNLLFMYGISYTTASNSALFISSSPLFAALIKAGGQKVPLSTRGVTGLILSSFGAGLIILNRTGGLTFSRQGMAGDILTLSAALFWALYTLKAKPLLERYSAVKITAYTMAAGTMMLLIPGAVELQRQNWIIITYPAWAALAFSAFIAGGVAYAFWYSGVKRIGATRTIIYHYLVPVVAVIFSALFLGERITIAQIMGGLAILTGVSLVQQTRNG